MLLSETAFAQSSEEALLEESEESVAPSKPLNKKAMIVGGAVTLGGMWLGTAAIAINGVEHHGEGHGVEVLWIPVVGPVAGIYTLRPNAGKTVALVFDAAAQAAGLGLLIAGIVAPDESQPASVSLVVEPGELSLVGRF